ncbi:MAG: galactose-1-phosphate uridylyltransferase [Candidatus Omnitrophica bacterium]|nr:galactose-1-phosphate uridylyltransferase [Candidatus Omnitrophota bacterium]
MGELRRDPIVGRWVIVETDSPLTPESFPKEEHRWTRDGCPFCYGSEDKTPPEIEAIREAGTQPNTPGWQVRVVPNKFPALQIEGDIERRGIGIYDMSRGVGAHEVIIQNPYHDKEIPDLLDEEVENIFKVCSLRIKDLKKDKRFKYILLFKNYGPSAGASLAHPHFQLIALPMIPKNPAEEIEGALEYSEFRGRCLFCDMLRQETEERIRLVGQSKYFTAFCPFVSRFPFEIWIIPKEHQSLFHSISGEEIADLAKILKDVLLRLRLTLQDPAYNFIIHSAPINQDEGLSHYHWHIEIMPKLTRVAGFEWGTGFYICSTPPELAAKYLKEEK